MEDKPFTADDIAEAKLTGLLSGKDPYEKDPFEDERKAYFAWEDKQKKAAAKKKQSEQGN